MQAVSLSAHHSLANHDQTAVRLKGTIVQIHLINPHSIIYVEEKNTDGQIIRRWAVEGPSVVQLRRQGTIALRLDTTISTLQGNRMDDGC